MKNEKLMEKKKKTTTTKASHKIKKTVKNEQADSSMFERRGTYNKATNDLWSPPATFKEQGLKRETHITISAK